MAQRTAPGTIAWTDLTVPHAEAVRDFYREVVGWTPEAVDMGGYADYNMLAPETGLPAAGICHAQGVNAHLPAVWMVYIVVADLAQSLAACRKGGGEVLAEPKAMGPGSAYAIIRDPAGAVAALYQVGA